MSKTAASTPASSTPAAARRLAALAYDLLLVAAIWMLITLLLLLASGGASIEPGNGWYQALLLVAAAAFFTGSWHRGGQTPGMRAWRLRVESRTGERAATGACAVRLVVGTLSIVTLGAGLYWQWFDRDGLPLYDRLAGTRTVLLPKGVRRP